VKGKRNLPIETKGFKEAEKAIEEMGLRNRKSE